MMGEWTLFVAVSRFLRHYSRSQRGMCNFFFIFYSTFFFFTCDYCFSFAATILFFRQAVLLLKQRRSSRRTSHYCYFRGDFLFRTPGRWRRGRRREVRVTAAAVPSSSSCTPCQSVEEEIFPFFSLLTPLLSSSRSIVFAVRLIPLRTQPITLSGATLISGFVYKDLLYDDDDTTVIYKRRNS